MGEKYLNDIISDDGKNDTNIKSRINKGTGLVNEISALLVEIMAGKEHFELSTFLRNSCLVSSLLFNCESWYDIKKKQIKCREKLDERLMLKFLNCSAKTPFT